MKKKQRAALRKQANEPAQSAVDPKSELSGKTTFADAHPWFWHLPGCLVLLLLVFLVYSNSFQSGWVLDNQFIIKLDPRIQQASWENLKLIWGKDYWWPRQETLAYRPIVSSSYLLNWSVLGSGKHHRESEQVSGFHWLNLAGHGINAILAYFLIWKLLRRHWTAFFSAGLFAVHPIATESVTNIIGRADEFVTMSFLGCTLLYIRSTETHSFRRLPWLFGVMVLFAAGCLSKELMPAFLAVPILFDGIYRWGSEPYRGRRVRRILLDFLCYIALTVPLLAVLFLRSYVFKDYPIVKRPFLDNPIARFDWNAASSLSVNIHNWILARMTACNVAAKAIWKLIWPVDLSSDYSYNQIQLFGWQLSDTENIKAILSVLLIAGTIALALWCYKRHKAVSFLIAFYWIAYGPTSNLLVISSSIFGDRFLYLPSFAFCALLVLGVDSLARRFGATLELDRKTIRQAWPRLVPNVALLLVLILYGVRGYVRNFDWRNDVTLAQSAVKVSPRSFRTYGKLAEAYYQADPVSNADRIIELGKKGLEIIDPLPNEENGTPSYVTLGIYYGFKGERVATRSAQGLLLMNDQTREWYQKSAQVLERGIEIDRAINETYRDREVKRGRTEIPDSGKTELYLYVGMAYERLGLNEKALQSFKYLRHLSPQDPAAYIKIASTQVELGQFEDAAVTFIQCLIVDPKRTDPWQWLTDIYAQINKEQIPAVQVKDGQSQLREDNKMVRKHLFDAYSGLMKILQLAERQDMLRQTREVATGHYQFDPKLLDAVLSQEVTRPVPASPVFHTYGKKLSEEQEIRTP